MRVGFGYDAHRLKEGRPFILGGVRIECSVGPDGHSDADVLLHAIIDALIGGAGLGDIGRHFPPSDSAYKDISSIVLLEKTVKLVREKGFGISNIDSTVVLETPKLASYIPKITEVIAKTIGCDASRVNVKAKTEEGMGFTGRKEGVSAYATVLLIEKGE